MDFLKKIEFTNCGCDFLKNQKLFTVYNYFLRGGMKNINSLLEKIEFPNCGYNDNFVKFIIYDNRHSQSYRKITNYT